MTGWIPSSEMLAGDVALVTGAASGIGAAIAQGFARAGARVVLADRDRAQVEVVASEISDAGGEVMALDGDVTEPDDVERWLMAGVDRWESVNVLVHSAAILGALDDALDFSLDGWRRTMDINVAGTVVVNQTIGRHMVEQRRGSIINLASVAGVQAHHGGLAYATSKHGVVGLTKVLAIEWGPYGVRVNAIAPGTVKTPMTTAVYDTETGVAAAEQETSLPLRRFATPEEMVGPAIFLASPMSSYVTGHILHVDGGFVL